MSELKERLAQARQELLREIGVETLEEAQAIKPELERLRADEARLAESEKRCAELEAECRSLGILIPGPV